MNIHSLHTNEESKNLELYAEEELGYHETTLMGMAALSVFHANEDLWVTAEEIWIICGTGGNGGDGYALANILNEEGYVVKIFQTDLPKSNAASFYFGLCVKGEVPILNVSELINEEKDVEPGTILLVDAILGIGFKGELSAPITKLITHINESPYYFYKLSLDTASGFNPRHKTTVWIEADSIEELGTRKWENIGFTGDDKMVPRYYESIGFPVSSHQTEFTFSDRFYWEKKEWEELIPLLKRKATNHKYSSGSAIFFGGDSGMEGAIMLSSSIFQGLGGGISKVFTPAESTKQSIIAKDPSRMVTLSDGYDIQSDSFYTKTKTLVMGPGIRNYPEFLKTFSLLDDQTLILDAGALPTFGDPLPKGGNILLTPHVGEFQRLTGVRCETIQDAYDIGVEFCKKHEVNILFKSFNSLYLTKTGEAFVLESPNAKLATMGTGDLLAGVIARFLSSNLSLVESVYYALSLVDVVREMPNSYPTAGEMLEYLIGKV